MGVGQLGGGGGTQSRKGTDCGPTATELRLSRAKIAKKEGLSSHCECDFTSNNKCMHLKLL